MPKPWSLTSREGLLCVPAREPQRHRASSPRVCTVTVVESVTGEHAAPSVPPTPLHGIAARERQPAWRVLFVICAVYTATHAARIGQPSLLAAGLLLAAVPFTALLLFAGVLQSAEKRPLEARIWALLWGALFATSASSYVNDLLGRSPDWTTIVIVAPVVEEAAKAAGLLLLMRYGRMRRLVDGIVYALLVGAGFSLVENTFYFLNAISAELAGQDGVLRDVFLMRGIVSPLAHPVFIAALALCASHRRTRRGPILLAAWLSGVALHALWNNAALLGVLPALARHTLALSAGLAVLAVLAVLRERRAIGDDLCAVQASLPASDEERWYHPLPWYSAGDAPNPR